MATRYTRYKLTINTRVECIYVCDHECACEKSITKGSIIYALRRHKLHLLHCSPLFSVPRILCSAAYVAYLAPDIDVVHVRPRVGELQLLEQPRQVLLAQRAFHHHCQGDPDLYQPVSGDKLVLQEYCFLDCEHAWSPTSGTTHGLSLSK